MKDVLCEKEISKHLNDEYNIKVFDEIDSTNVYLKQLAKNNADTHTVIIADTQTSGHGRFDRKFHSPKNSGIYMSVLLKPDLEAEKSVLLTAAAAVAVNEAIFSLTGKKTEIKWVNDILLEGKKVCGILTEGAINPKTLKFDWAIIGIGVNVYTPENDFNSEIKNIAGAVSEKTQENLRNKLCTEILNNISLYCENLQNKSFISKYKEYSYLKDKRINVIRNGSSTPATALFIDDECRLAVRYDDETEELLNSGEISIKL
ncbi:MAG: biotin--[Clostridia bacterium]|nr:biotin--[acetyl-CoA-carboxylase] ligase [Clostridia bacterium]